MERLLGMLALIIVGAAMWGLAILALSNVLRGLTAGIVQ